MVDTGAGALLSGVLEDAVPSQFRPQAALVHVLADAMVSVLVITGLVLARASRVCRGSRT